MKPAPASPFNFNRTITLDNPSLGSAFIPFTVDQGFNDFNVRAHTGPVEPEEEPMGIIRRENIREAAKRYDSTLRPKSRALNTAQTSAISQPQANPLAPTTDSVMNPFNPALFKSFPKPVLPTGSIFGSASNTPTRAPFKIVTDFNSDSFHAFNMQPSPSKKADVPVKTENTPATGFRPASILQPTVKIPALTVGSEVQSPHPADGENTPATVEKPVLVSEPNYKRLQAFQDQPFSQS
jgi:hypothetical protein